MTIYRVLMKHPERGELNIKALSREEINAGVTEYKMLGFFVIKAIAEEEVKDEKGN